MTVKCMVKTLAVCLLMTAFVAACSGDDYPDIESDGDLSAADADGDTPADGDPDDDALDSDENPTDGDDPTDGDVPTDGDMDDDVMDLDDNGDEPVVSIEEALARFWQLLSDDGDNHDAAFEAWLAKEPIPAGQTIVAAFDEDLSLDIADDSWLFVIDERPGALFDHPMRYILIPLDGSNPISFDATSPPLLTNPVAALPELVFATTSYNSQGAAMAAPATTRDDPPALRDYGDAPESLSAYYGGVAGYYPVRESSDGARTQSCEYLHLGPDCSQEAGPEDPSDPDGRPNFVDQDQDDGVIWSLGFAPGGVKHTIIARVNVADHADAPQTQYLNVLFDRNRDGDWADDGEWIVENHTLNLAADTVDEWVVLDVTLPDTAEAVCGGAWARVVLSDSEVAGDTWTGTGEYAQGEVEDLYIRQHPQSPEVCHPILPPPDWEDPPPDGDVDGDSADGDEPDDVCDIPIGKQAIVLAGPDHAEGVPIVRLTAAAMNQFLKSAGYQSSILRPQSNADVSTALTGLAANVKCLDRVMIYVIAHGRAKNGQGTAEMRLASSELISAADFFQAIASAIPPCPGGSKEAGECETASQACNLTLIVESCFSGSFASELGSLGDKTGRTLILSSASDKPSWTENGTGYVAQAIQAAADNPDAVDADQNGEITPLEWANYIHQYVQKASGKHNQNTSQSITAPNCPCDCCGDGIVQSSQENVNGVMQPSHTEACERPGDVCIGGSGIGICDSVCLCPPLEGCGDGTVQSGEECGEPGLAACEGGESCVRCVCVGDMPVCGNGTAEPGEQCGEPGRTCPEGQYCGEDCQCYFPYCGNGLPEMSEECGEPGLSACPGREYCKDCRCFTPICGNDTAEPGETCGEPGLPQCPDGQYCAESTCTCVEPVCGNNTAEMGEACGEPGLSDCPQGQYCSDGTCTCLTAACNNGTADPGETCGEPGLAQCPDGQYCSDSTCTCVTPTCGNDAAEPGEECGEPGLDACDEDASEMCIGCKCVVVTPVCGNGVIEPKETCGEPDLPDCPSGQYCNHVCHCTTPVCGNGFGEPGEVCGESDLPACSGGSYCNDSCQCVMPVCGNDNTEPGEDCDSQDPSIGCPDGQLCHSCRCYPETCVPQKPLAPNTPTTEFYPDSFFDIFPFSTIDEACMTPGLLGSEAVLDIVAPCVGPFSVILSSSEAATEQSAYTYLLYADTGCTGQSCLVGSGFQFNGSTWSAQLDYYAEMPNQRFFVVIDTRIAFPDASFPVDVLFDVACQQ